MLLPAIYREVVIYEKIYAFIYYWPAICVFFYI